MKNERVPKILILANWLASKFINESFLEEFLGDLKEIYEERLSSRGRFYAKWMYWVDALHLLMGFTSFSRFTNSNTLTIFMLSNHLKISWRNLRRNRGYSSLNLLGLILGFTTSLLIYLWVENEIATDNQQSDSDRIFIIYSREVYEGGTNAERNTPARLPEEIKKTFPEIEFATGYAKSFRMSLKGVTQETFQVNDNILKMSGTRGSPDFFKVFDFKLIEGTAESALPDRHNIAISRKMADIFFGSAQEAINQMIRYENQSDLIITAVFEDIGDESTLKFDYLTHWDAWVDSDPIKQSWGHFGTETYIKLKKNSDPWQTSQKIKDFLGNFMEFDDTHRFELDMQKFGDGYLFGNYVNGRPAEGRIAYVRIFRGIGLFILMIAIINFINITTATASRRHKEIGIRKVIGASRLSLKTQFVTESTLLALIGISLSIGLVILLLPVFNSITHKSIVIPFSDGVFWLRIVAMTVVIGFVSGAYPALVLSRIKLISALKSIGTIGSRPSIIRRGLVTFQFALSILLIVAALVVSKQAYFARNKQLGFDKKDLLYIPLEGELLTNYSLFRSKASIMPGIVMVDRSAQTPHDMGFSVPWFSWDGKDPNDHTLFTSSSVGFDFISLMKLKIVEGRDFSRKRPADLKNYIVNEAAVEAMGGDDALGKTVSIFGKTGKIVGVIKDFHYNSLHLPIRPMALDVKEDLNFGTALVRIEEGKTKIALNSLETVCNEINPGYAFSYTFVEDTYEDMYKVESTMSTLTQYFASLAILISCLGLFGLVALATELRMKEIGIRKILGATIANIFQLLSKEYVLLLVISAAIAIPIAVHFMRQWLNQFAYRIELDWWIFGLACILTIGISFIVIGSRILESALTNPINSLRDD